MYDEYEDFYQQSSEFDEKIEELKSELSQSVKKEIMDELKSLRKENAELRPIKEDISKLEREFYNKKVHLEREYEQKKRDVRRERISELFKDFNVEYWSISYDYEEKEKCNKCDKNRRIHYKTPLGREEYESCDCATKTTIYKPLSTILNTLSLRRDNEVIAWYKVRYEGTEDEYFDYNDDSIRKGDNFIKEESQINIEKMNAYNAMFETKELAQIYCDLKNENNKIEKFKTEEIELIDDTE